MKELGLRKNKLWLITGVWLIILGVFIFLTLNKNSKSSFERSNYQYEAWADKGGYYIYLPWIFNYELGAGKFDKNISERLGDGFSIENDKLISKYTIGVAVMQLPFYCLAHINALFLYENPSGFEKVYMNWMGVGSVFYLWIGLILAVRLLKRLSSLSSAILSVVIVIFGTNLFYYSFDETLMSHVYSFSLISLFSYLLLKGKKVNPYLITLLIILIGIVRPTNVIYVLLMMIVFRKHFALEWKSNIQSIILPVFLGAVITVLQIAYWQYAYDSFYPKGYEGESFTNFLTPKILKVLFEPHNGWFPYALPVFISFIIGLLLLRKIELKRIFIFGLSVAAIYVYITASWWTYDFGCGLGARNLVDFSFLWMLMLGMIYKVLAKNKLYFYSITGVFLITVVTNLLISYHYDNCWFGSQDWDWGTYLKLIK